MFFGLDVHKKYIQAVCIDDQGNLVAEQRLENNTETIKEFMQSANYTNVAMESSYGWFNIYNTLEQIGIKPTLVNVRRTKIIAESKIKTDKLDALAIAQCLRTGFIATSYSRGQEYCAVWLNQ